jgi:hypothetical protein
MAVRLYKDNPVLNARALRAMANFREHSQTGVLERAATSGEPLILGLADGTQRKVVVLETTHYELRLEDGLRSKREVLFAFPPRTAKKLKMDLRRNPEIATLGLVPAVRPKERLWISKMILQRLIDESIRARFTMLDGSMIPCRLRSFGMWELNCDVKGEELVIFRHGVYRLEVGTDLLADHVTEGLPLNRTYDEPLDPQPPSPQDEPTG